MCFGIKYLFFLTQVMDTPGLFDTKQNNEETGVVIVKSIINMHPGPDAILCVIRLGVRFTDEEYGAYMRFKHLFGFTVTKHMIILFTGGDIIQKKGKSIEQTLQNAPEALQKVLEECSGRYVVFNNEASTSEKHSQVQKLLQLVQSLKERNEDNPYVCASYSAIGDSLEEVETLKKEVRQKMREVEDEEVRLTELFQEQEMQLREKVQELKLSDAKQQEEIKKIKSRLADERRKMTEEWQEQKFKEEEALKAKKKELEQQLKNEREKQEQNLRMERDAHYKHINDELDDHKKELEKKRNEMNEKWRTDYENHRKQLQNELDEFRRKMQREEEDAAKNRQMKIDQSNASIMATTVLSVAGELLKVWIDQRSQHSNGINTVVFVHERYPARCSTGSSVDGHRFHKGDKKP